IPVGYFGDPVKSAETFREMEGQRWSIPGDFARIEADGTLVLLGRGSVSINTGGEKVFPEEVEEALKLLAEVSDANVVGVPDPKWGSAVTAVVELIDGAEITDQAMIDGLRSHLSGYKLPKNIVRVDSVFRAPNGKADYKWATAIAKSSLGMD
ncbi:MAG: acyl-CoA synthetase, partial [Acidimicrobiaceae bacterium]|nr:acyl-CoA synthetase [Acidimicrobiaceae bacterium]